MNTIDLEDIELKVGLESPSIQKRRIENDKFKNEWAGCCSRTNKHFLKYITQIAMGSCVMIFSMVQILRGAPNKEIYFSLFSSTATLFMPYPQPRTN
jgi:hypothetical protein